MVCGRLPCTLLGGERLLGGICIRKRSHTLSSWSFKLYTESFNKSCNKETHMTRFFKLMGLQIQAFVYRLLTSSHNQPPTEHPKGKAELGDKPVAGFGQRLLLKKPPATGTRMWGGQQLRTPFGAPLREASSAPSAPVSTCGLPASCLNNPTDGRGAQQRALYLWF